VSKRRPRPIFNHTVSTKENLMACADYSQDRPTSIVSSVSVGAQLRPRAVRRLAFDSVIGFLSGGVILGTTGAIIGACLPYAHPVASILSALWWAVYFGCFGANIGALLGLWAENMTAPPAKGLRYGERILNEQWTFAVQRMEKQSRRPHSPRHPE
jgi:hypothetical protein